ncbi:peptidase C14 [Hypoxylon sp. FL1857]|nr:peptidase C14 [Hypoxylon sp. FL1857]
MVSLVYKAIPILPYSGIYFQNRCPLIQSTMDRTRFVTPFTIGLGLASLGYILFSPVINKIRRRSQKLRDDGLKILVDPSDAQFEIVAVHGLGADPDHTWEGVAPTNDNRRANFPKVHLLRDILKNDFGHARIFSFAHNSDWLVDAPIQSAQGIGERLLEQLMRERQSPKLPIIFIGHSFGGIIIKEALCASGKSGDIPDNTCGIVFLGTPHQGSSASSLGAIIASLTGFLGSDSTLLLSLQSHGTYLSDLESQFRRWISSRSRKPKVISFYETKPTYIFGWFSIGRIVDRDSAYGFAIESDSMDTDHSGMNKFTGRKDQQYKRLKEKINDLIPFDEAYKYIRDKIYTEERLKIERLSGHTLPMEQCYINLAIVRQHGKDTQHSKDRSEDTPFSRSSRLKVETPVESLQVNLPTLFDPYELPNGLMKVPRRILIRGRAGVGKTTLCKKIVHDFTYGSLWKNLFDRVLWVPLRKLKEPKCRENLCKMFSHIYFADSGGITLARALQEAIDDPKYSSKTLFILDGLDEVFELVNSSRDERSNLLMNLINKPDVIITARPHIMLPYEFEVADLELETIGFYPNQVDCYLEKVVKDVTEVKEIQLFLQKHWLLQSLVRIPIQLDALCLIWDGGFKGDTTLEIMIKLTYPLATYLSTNHLRNVTYTYRGLPPF